MIVWLASYPKSGNTWIRSILSTLIFSDNENCNFDHLKKVPRYPDRSHCEGLEDDLSDINKIKKIWLISQSKLNLDNSIKILKTHHVNCKIGKYEFTNSENTLGVIHIVRDPRNIITSIKNHYALKSYKEALKFITDEKKMIGTGRKIPQIISSWKTNYISWKAVKKNYLIIKYEDLIKNTELEINKILNYLYKLHDFKINQEQISKVIRSSSFKNFQKLENENKFNENTVNLETNEKIKFFNQGPHNDWNKLISKDIRLKIETEFKYEMSELGYL